MEPRVIARAPEGLGCPRCGGFVYAAEQKLARGRVSILLILFLIVTRLWGFGLNLGTFLCSIIS